MKKSPPRIKFITNTLYTYLGCFVFVLIIFKLNENAGIGRGLRISPTPWELIIPRLHIYAFGAIIMNLPFLFYFYGKFKEESKE